MADKVKLEFTAPKNVKVNYNGITIEVNPFLTTAQQVFLISKYLEEYFNKNEKEENLTSESKYSHLNAEYSMINYILQLKTNIDTENLDNNFYSDTDFTQKITASITNYFDFRNKLNFIINEIKQQNVLDSSVGTVLSNLIEKALVILDKFSEISPEELEKARDAGLELLEKLEKSKILEK